MAAFGSHDRSGCTIRAATGTNSSPPRARATARRRSRSMTCGHVRSWSKHPSQLPSRHPSRHPSQRPLRRRRRPRRPRTSRSPPPGPPGARRRARSPDRNGRGSRDRHPQARPRRRRRSGPGRPSGPAASGGRHAHATNQLPARIRSDSASARPSFGSVSGERSRPAALASSSCFPLAGGTSGGSASPSHDADSARHQRARRRCPRREPRHLMIGRLRPPAVMRPTCRAG